MAELQMVKKHEKMPNVTSSQENANVKTSHLLIRMAQVLMTG